MSVTRLTRALPENVDSGKIIFVACPESANIATFVNQITQSLFSLKQLETLLSLTWVESALKWYLATARLLLIWAHIHIQQIDVLSIVEWHLSSYSWKLSPVINDRYFLDASSLVQVAFILKPGPRGQYNINCQEVGIIFVCLNNRTKDFDKLESAKVKLMILKVQSQSTPTRPFFYLIAMQLDVHPLYTSSHACSRRSRIQLEKEQPVITFEHLTKKQLMSMILMMTNWAGAFTPLKMHDKDNALHCEVKHVRIAKLSWATFLDVFFT